MKFSENWLRELVEVPVERDALVHRLTMAGLEVEGVEVIGATLDGVVVVQILACEPHPAADKLRVCRVDAGRGEPLTIVCGAPNARARMKAPLATVGTRMPNGMEIRSAVLRGVESHGMLCSAKELGLDADASGLFELAPEAPVGEPLANWLGLPDASIEVKLTPNRPDCLSVLGLARDTAALFATAFYPPQTGDVAPAGDARRGARLDAGPDCPRYLARVIEDVDASAPTPSWLAERLRRGGIRPVGAIVDITQYVMLELGQPMHAYDDAALAGDITVRRAAAGERVALLDGSTHALDDGFLVIADDAGVQGIAGIMGGQASRVTATTRRVLLEAAHFAPSAVAGRARRLGLHTDASHRFERGVDAALPARAIERATELVLAIAGGRAGPVGHAVREADLPQRPPVLLRRARLERLLGLAVADDEVERILGALGLEFESTPEGWRARPPSWRFDLAIEEDLIEEVVRVHGYERVPSRAPRGELPAPVLPEARLEPTRLRAQLAARDYVEAVCYAFVDAGLLARWQLGEGAIALANPLSAEFAVMRTSLLPGLVAALVANRRRQQPRVRLFEIGNVFHEGRESASRNDPADSYGAQSAHETLRIAGVACGPAVAENWASKARALDFFDLKGDIESLFALTGAATGFAFAADPAPWLHPGQAARVCRDGRHIGHAGALHPDLARALDLDEDVYLFELDVEPLAARALPRAEPLSRFPSVRRDLSFELPEAVPYAEVERAIRDAVGGTLAAIIPFDRYAGPNLGAGIKSLAMGLILQDRSRTLTDQDADRCVALAVAALEARCTAKLRG